MCSWCWGFSRTLSELLGSLPDDIEVRRLLGGLAADTDFPMPESMQQQIKSNWTRIEDTISGVKFNFDFWSRNTPRRSTYPACRAVIAARQQGEKYDVLMTQAIQNAYYQQALNPSDNTILIELAGNLNLSIDKFKKDLVSKETEEKLIEEINFSKELHVESFPNLVFATDKDVYSIKLDYNNSETMLNAIHSALIESTG
jgi:putative protein-disulfide isomerase